MKRNVQNLARQAYDLLIIGGGVYGAACAWDASLRGLKVALLERADFGGATSANSLKIAHSGSRYLQHADFTRLRESIRECYTLMRIAPHLVTPHPFLLPIYGHGIKGREVMTLYFAIYNMLSLDRKWAKDPARRLPGARMIAAPEVLNIMPEVKREGLTGGCIWYEGQLRNTERLTLSYILSASKSGAEVANYVEVVGFLQVDNVIVGIKARDLVSGETFTVRAKVTLNASGPWTVKTLNLARQREADDGLHASKALSLITRPLTKDYALAISHKPIYHDRQALVNKGSSFAFAIPWRHHSLIGSLHLPCRNNPESVTISKEEIQRYIALINEAYPPAKLRLEDVRHVLWGIIPADRAGSAAPLKHYHILDHAREDGLENLMSVVGVKYTTARDVAQKAVDLVYRKLAQVPPKSHTQHTSLWGGDIAYMEDFVSRVVVQDANRLAPEVLRHLVQTYGSAYSCILSYLHENPAWGQVIPNSQVTQAEVIHAIREEMAEKLADVVFRRTDLGTLGYPGHKPLRVCAELMSRELDWDRERTEIELSEVVDTYIIRPMMDYDRR